MEKNILKLEKMGCDFREDNFNTDLTNHRYYARNIKLKNGVTCDVIEISNGARYTDESLKKGKSVDMFGTWFQTYYRDDEGICWGLSDIDKELNKNNYKKGNLYNKNTILDVINSISAIKYDDIEEVA